LAQYSDQPGGHGFLLVIEMGPYAKEANLGKEEAMVWVV